MRSTEATKKYSIAIDLALVARGLAHYRSVTRARIFRVALQKLASLVIVVLGIVAGGIAAAAPPPAPAILAPSSGASVTVPFMLAWSPVISNPSGVIGYNWQLSTSSTFTPLIDMDSTDSLTTQDTVSGLVNGSYFWRVQAVNQAGEQGAFSAARSFTVTGVGPGSPATPVLAPTQGYNTFHPFEAVTFNWTAVANAPTYRLEFSTDPNFVLGTPATSWSDNLRTPTDTLAFADPGNYFARVFATDSDFSGGIRSLPSNVIQFSVAFNNPIGPPPAPVYPVASEALTLPVTLKWAHVPNPQVLGYDLQVATSSTFSVASIEVPGQPPGATGLSATLTQLTFPEVNFPSLTSGTKFWRVFSHQGNASATTSAVTAPSASGTFTIGAAPATPVSVALLGVSLQQVYSGFPSAIGVQLSAAAPAGGAIVALSSSNPGLVPVPATLTVPAILGKAGVDVSIGQVSSATPVTITATLNGVSASGQFTVLPLTLKLLRAAPLSITGGSPNASVTVELNGRAPAGGAVVNLSSNSAVASVPSTISIPAGASAGGANVTTSAVAQSSAATLTASFNGATAQTQIAVNPQLPPATLSVDPTSRIWSDQGTATGRVSIASLSANDQTYQVTSSHPSIVSNNAVTIPAGSPHAGFIVITNSVQVPTVVTLSASGGGVTLSIPFPVYPTGTAPSLSTITVNPSSVMGGSAVEGFVNLNSMAPAGGLVVLLSDNSPTVTVPASVTVPAGATSRSFTVNTSAVSADTTATISGTLGTTQSAALKVTPGATGPFLASVVVNPPNLVGGTGATGIVRLSAAASVNGAVVSLFRDSSAVSIPVSVTVPADNIAAIFPVTSSAVTAPTAVSVSGEFGGRVELARLNLTAPATGPVVSAVTLNPTRVVGGDPSTATVTMSAPAPSGGLEVIVGHTSLALAEELVNAAVVTVPAGASSATFTVNTYRVAATMTANIKSTFGGITRSAVLTVDPAAAAAPTLSTVLLNPTSVVGGTASTGTVSLSAAAPSGGALVTLSSSSTAATVPASVSVAAGATSATFNVATGTVTAATAATVSAVFAGVTRSAALTVNPAAASAPAAPTLVSPADGATVAQPVLFDWSDVANATSYEIQIDDSSTIAAPFTVNQTVTASQVSIGGLPAQRLWWRVRARNSAGVFGPFSATRRFTAQATPAAASLSAVSVNPTSVVGGNSSTGTVTLTTAAPTGGAVVTLTSSNTAAAGVPASVTLAAGATSTSFSMTTSAVSANTSVTLTGTYSGVSRTATLTVTPVPPPASLNTLALSPSSVTGGSSSTGTVTLTSAAAAGGAVVALTSNTAAATVPASVTVAAGASSATFTAMSTAVTAATTATITAALAGVTRTAVLTLNPPSTNVTLTVTATGRSGETVTSSPAGINVSVGSSGTAPFAANTAITLSVAGDRDAIWSGACSSGGNKAKTCVFTITGNASVTGNVQ